MSKQTYETQMGVMKPAYCYECGYYYTDVFAHGRCDHPDKACLTYDHRRACSLALPRTERKDDGP